VNVKSLLEEVDVLATSGDLEAEVRGLCYDSRRTRPGDAFFALPGLRADGRSFVQAALQSGVVAVVSDTLDPWPGSASVRVREPRLALAQAANRFHDHPSRAMRVVSVTGTNGKTTTTYLLESIFHAAGWSAGVIGTTGARFAGQTKPLAFTTPESPELQALLRDMAEARVEAVALEVSSHALAQRRSYGLEGDVLVFTNLSHDHLDYHGSMAAYLDAKLMLFDGRNGPTTKRATAVVNLDDAVAPTVLLAAERQGSATVTYGRDARSAIRLGAIRSAPQGLGLEIMPVGEAAGAVPVALPMLGAYNAWNAAAAFASARALGISIDAARRGLESAGGVPGRLERVEAGQEFHVVVDYAHTPDALERALSAVREHFPGRVLLVFGCGGDRDRAKRPRMGEVAARDADRAWVTSDNPRSEDPAAIARDILAGAPHGRLTLELDRRAAIAAALGTAATGDVVLIAGKGHETTQTIGDRVLPFDDRLVARELLTAGGRRA
jgi:UDP-N-acetylmuramoyl-L-alanyl-D-glutamate--2,6-diaminopimelate ligase